MPQIARRMMLASLAGTVLGLALHPVSLAQQAGKAASKRPQFSFDELVERAKALAEAEYEEKAAALPAVFQSMDWDQWRNIRFRPDKALLRNASNRYNVQLFHLGHLFKRPVTINTVREGIVSPVPYSTDLFDYGGLRLPRQLPITLGFAGFRVHYPLNAPNTQDELISFVGSSYFRWLGRDQKYGLSARGLAIGTGRLDNKEEFPFFREFWVDNRGGKSRSLAIYALLDSPSVTGAYHFEVHPGDNSYLDVNVTLFARKPLDRIGMAPLTSMYFLGENDRHMNDRNKYDEFRPELHDSDGLLVHTAGGEWIWRPIKNPLIQEVQHFPVKDIKGFGLMQRDRRFESYQDIELNYEQRPSYWIEPKGNWGEGVVELIELATKDETFDNIITAFLPKAPLEKGKTFSFAYRMHSMQAGLELHKLGYASNTFVAPAHALGSNEERSPLARRLMIDFAGGDMAYYLQDPKLVEVAATAQNAKVTRSFVVANPAGKGLRVMVDVTFEADKVGTIKAYLTSGGRRITETWTYAWRHYNL
jgi:glucans biosynthesis protein